MKIILVHNKYRVFGGEDYAVNLFNNLIKCKGNNVISLFKNSDEIGLKAFNKFNAFINGIYSRSSYNAFLEIVNKNRPYIVHVHNLYPGFSPSILRVCRKIKIPLVMTLHNYRLTCPIGTHFIKGKICEKCLNGREYFCIINNCRNNVFESVAYSLRNIIARKFRLFSENISIMIVMSQFQKERINNAGFQNERIFILPNFIKIPEVRIEPHKRDYIAFVGRFSPEKGVETLIEAAKYIPYIPIKIAGKGWNNSKFLKSIPKNIKFVGWLNRKELEMFYSNARFVILPSRCFEVFPMVLAEAMSYSLPVIASNIGGIPEIVENGLTGLLYEPGNSIDLANKIRSLWQNKKMIEKMGQEGRKKAIREFSHNVYYKRLTQIYMNAIELNSRRK